MLQQIFPKDSLLSEIYYDAEARARAFSGITDRDRDLIGNDGALKIVLPKRSRNRNGLCPGIRKVAGTS